MIREELGADSQQRRAQDGPGGPPRDADMLQGGIGAGPSDPSATLPTAD